MISPNFFVRIPSRTRNILIYRLCSLTLQILMQKKLKVLECRQHRVLLSSTFSLFIIMVSLYHPKAA